MPTFRKHLLLFAGLLITTEAVAVAQTADEPKAMPQGIAVVELFTSQGCSSCPPADSHLQKIASVAKETGLAIYPLSFHVDYWNQLGWKDPFSEKAYSQRQRQYATHWNSRRIYTPQMIVNGSTEFLGSDRKTGFAAINAALRKTPRVNIQLTLLKTSGKSLTVDYAAHGLQAGDVINFAVVQNPKAIAVKRGENSGRELSHVNVVRAFHSVDFAATDNGRHTNTVEILIPADVRSSEAKVIAFVQERHSRNVVGAAISDE